MNLDNNEILMMGNGMRDRNGGSMSVKCGCCGRALITSTRYVGKWLVTAGHISIDNVEHDCMLVVGGSRVPYLNVVSADG